MSCVVCAVKRARWASCHHLDLPKASFTSVAGLEIIDGAEPEGLGDGRPPGGPLGQWGSGGFVPRSWRHILKITIVNIVSCDHCINIELAILAEWIKIVPTVSIFSLFSPSSCNAHWRRGVAAPTTTVNRPLHEYHFQHDWCNVSSQVRL